MSEALTPRVSLPRAQIPVLLLEGIHERAEAAFRRRGYTNVTRLPRALSGDALSQPDVLAVGFRTAMLAAAALVGAGGVTSALFLPSRDESEAPVRRPRYACPVDGTHVGAVGAREAVDTTSQ